MAILTGLPPSARASAGSSGQNGADAGIEALLAGRALAGEAGNDSSGAAGSDPFSAALQVALSRVGAGLQEEQQALLDAAALAAQGQVGQILPNGVIMSPDQQANFAAGTPTSDAQLQAIDAAAQLASQTAGQAVDAALAQQTGDLADQAAAQQVVLATQASADQQALANAAAQDTALVTGQPTLGSSQAQQTASVVQLTPEQLAQAQAAAAQQTAAQGDESQGADVDPALLANLPVQANVGNASITANGQQAAASANGMVGLVQAGNGQQTANQQAANDDQQQSAAGDTAGLLSAVIDESTKDSAERFNLVMDGKQIGAPAMAANANTQSAQLVGQLSANGQANAQALNAAQTPAGTVVADIQTATESASTQMAARTESRVEALRASLGSGPINMEVLKLTGAGGGRAVIEVTPPNQGPIRLDLQLDGNGKANLLVDGLTDSMKARLESSAGFLRQDMAGMGLTLNLELRERNDGQAAMQFSQQFSGSNQSGGSGSSRADNGQGVATVGMTAPAGRGQSSTSTDNGVNLYA
ncbi:MAG: hypothetical protein ACO2Z7_04440 [Burkholderiaceae bacterium]